MHLFTAIAPLSIMKHQLLSTDNKLVRLIVEPDYRWLRHLLLCMLLLTVSYENVVFTFGKDFKILGWVIPLLILIQFSLYMSFYLNIYLLVPRFFLKGRYLAYSVSLFVLLSLNFVGSYSMEIIVSSIYSLEPSYASYANPARSILVDYLSLITVTGMCCIGTTITILFRNWLTDGKRKQDMENEHRRKGVLKVKDKLNPLFLSKILSVAAAKTEYDASFSEDILIRLSRFLRYRLYDSGRDVVFLQSEISYLNNYLSIVADVRNGFAYSVTCESEAGRTILSPSVLTGVTDVLINNSKEGLPLVLAIEFVREERVLAINLTAESPGLPSVDATEEMLKNVLEVSFTLGYDLQVRGGCGKIYIRIGLNYK